MKPDTCPHPRCLGGILVPRHSCFEHGEVTLSSTPWATCDLCGGEGTKAAAVSRTVDRLADGPLDSRALPLVGEYLREMAAEGLIEIDYGAFSGEPGNPYAVRLPGDQRSCVMWVRK